MLEELYEEVSKKACDMVERSPGVALGFHSVADGLVETDERKLQEVLNEHSVLLKEPPESIETVEDFLTGYLYTFSTGKALQLMIDEEEVREWIEKTFGKGKLRLGGTSANMAVALASFGFPKVLVYAYPLVEELAKLFPDLPNLKTVSPDGRVVHPSEGWKGKELGALHWIFEVKKGQKIRLEGEEIVCPRDNRFIASWNPVNSKLKIADYFKKAYMEMVEEYPKFLLAGFHIMRDVYPDGETVEDRMEEIVSFVREIREKGAKVHVEMASVRRKRVRKALIEMVLPEVDSLGLNEVELSWLAADLGLKEDGILEGDIDAVAKALDLLIKRTGLKRVHFHTLGYYALVSEEEDLKGLVASALAAAFRAETGKVPRCDELKMAMKHRISEKGIEISRRAPKWLKILPTRIVENPKLTVGLGDTISSIAFALA